MAAFQGFADQAVRRLIVLDNAESLRDLAGLPSNCLEALRGKRAGQYGIRINAQWRICFRWGEDGPYEARDGDSPVLAPVAESAHSQASPRLEG